MNESFESTERPVHDKMASSPSTSLLIITAVFGKLIKVIPHFFHILMPAFPVYLVSIEVVFEGSWFGRKWIDLKAQVENKPLVGSELLIH